MSLVLVALNIKIYFNIYNNEGLKGIIDDIIKLYLNNIDIQESIDYICCHN